MSGLKKRIRLDNMNGQWSVMDMATLTILFRSETLPECLEERVALLRLADDEQIVKGLGFRWHDKIFYLDLTGEVDAAVKQQVLAGSVDVHTKCDN